MRLGQSAWQDDVLADRAGGLVMISPGVAPSDGYDFEWWRMVEDRVLDQGGRPCTYNLAYPSGYFATIVSTPLVVAFVDFAAETEHGAVRVTDKRGIVAAREWRRRGLTTRPQRGDELWSAQEYFYVEDVDVVEKRAPDGVVRDVKYRLRLTGAAHRRA